MAEELRSTAGNDLPAQNTAPAPVSAPAAPEPVQRTYTDNDVNDIVARKKQAAYDKGYNEAIRTSQTPNQTSTQTSQSVTPDLDRLVTEKVAQIAEQQRSFESSRYYEQEAQKVAASIHSKMLDAKSRYADYDDVVQEPVISQFPDIVILANEIDNGGDLLYDLMKNPTKLTSLQQTIDMARKNNQSYLWNAARQQANQIASSIKANIDGVANKPAVSAPLSQMKSSNVGDTGKKSFNDLRRSLASR